MSLLSGYFYTHEILRRETMKKAIQSFLIMFISIIFFIPPSYAETVDIAVDGLWDSGTLFFLGQTFSITFNVPEGTFPYHCTFHWASGMKGTIIVQPDAFPDTIPLPSEPQTIGYENVTSPELNLDPLQAKPVGLGPVSTGGLALIVQVGLDQFSEPVNIYGAYSLSTSPNVVNVLKPGGKTFQTLTIAQVLNAFSTGVPPAGIQPWLSGVTGPVNENLFNTPVFTLPEGTYMVYLLVTPVGDISSYYLWITNFTAYCTM
jgi:hypothetical protein